MTSIHSAIRKRLPLSVVLCGFCCGCFAEQFVQISTEIEIIVYPEINHPKPERRQERRRTYSATITTSTNRWSIHTTQFLSNAEEVHYFDGTNVYKWLRITSQAPQAETVPGKPHMTSPSPEDGSIQVEIFPGEHPLGNMSVNVPWLVYCSGNYLRQEGRVIPKPAPVIRDMPDAFGFADKTIVFQDMLGLPKSVELYTSKSQLKRGVKDPRIRRSLETANILTGSIDSIDDGTLVFRYSVEKETNYLGWTIPVDLTERNKTSQQLANQNQPL